MSVTIGDRWAPSDPLRLFPIDFVALMGNRISIGSIYSMDTTTYS